MSDCITYTDVPGDYPELQKCAKSTWVTYAQELLTNCGFPPQDGKRDIYYGPFTTEAVRDFQGSNGLPVDGIVGPDTWTALEACSQGGAQASASQTSGTQISGAGSVAHLEFDTPPFISNGGLYWTVRSAGSGTVPAGTPAGSYDLYDASDTEIKGGSVNTTSDLQPGQISGYLGTDRLLDFTPNDGTYQAGVDLNDNVIHYVDYVVKGGQVTAP